MPPLPRGVCQVCGLEVALRKGWLLREHRTAGALCEGSGRRAVLLGPLTANAVTTVHQPDPDITHIE